MKHKFIIIFVILVSFGYAQKKQVRFNKVRQFINGDNAAQLFSFLDSCLFKDYHRDSALFFKGLVNLRLNKTVEAIKYHKLLVNEFPDFWESHYLQGLIFFIQKRYHESVTELSIVIKHNQNDWRAYYDRALGYGQIDAAVAAIEDLDACIRINPKFAAAYYSRAYYLESTENYKEAIKDYQQNILLEPKNFDAYIGMAYAYQKLKDIHMACETINDAVKKGSQAANEIKNNFCKGK